MADPNLAEYAEHGPECVLHCVDHEPDAECDCGLEQAIDAYESQAARIAELEAALRELVECKDLHDTPVGKYATKESEAHRLDYNRRKPLAWEAARRALASPREPK